MNSPPVEHLFRHFEKYIRLSDELKRALNEKLGFVHFKKGELILDANKVCTHSYFIISGLVRAYYLKDGKEISEYFPAENEWCNSPKSFITRQKDIYYIDAIENTEAFSLHVNDLVQLFDQFPEMERYSRLSMGTVFGHLMERIASLRFTTAKEKYAHFLQTYHDIYHRIPLGMIASYLGITQETLSRIRADN
ncbi:Crp/Fnr family transcriptional regulator [Flavihumibacter sp. UBA7668]|uniref:Crp/Fnr family transcriptional regulator n=1 Tax=Flavihumibacter sp. UBA7668 TaxID=1946542 RepID=UPI0025BABE3F|nr:Crp/Fnr family transcriptional regulator [Flavihumibacter sp. UBA7668]